MNKVLLLFIKGIAILSNPIAQENKYFYLNYNPLQAVLNEHTFELEYKPMNNLSLSVAYGRVHDNGLFTVNLISDSQDKKPGTVYTGNAYRSDLKIYLVNIPKFSYYLGIGGYHKDLSYKKKKFYDSWGDDGDITYWRNETAYINAWRVTSGFKLFTEINESLFVVLEFFSGIDRRFRFRNIETYEREYYGAEINPEWRQLGYQEYEQVYYAPFTGLKIGLLYSFSYNQ